MLNDHLNDLRTSYTNYKRIIFKELGKPAVHPGVVDRHSAMTRACIVAGRAVQVALQELRNAYGAAMHGASHTWAVNQELNFVNEERYWQQQIQSIESRRDRVAQKIPARMFDMDAKARAERGNLMAGYGQDPFSSTDGLNTVPGEWKCVREFSGGLSRGGLWVQYDENNVVRNVRPPSVLLGNVCLLTIGISAV
jgi:hypothetical protein